MDMMQILRSRKIFGEKKIASKKQNKNVLIFATVRTKCWKDYMIFRKFFLQLNCVITIVKKIIFAEFDNLELDEI